MTTTPLSSAPAKLAVEGGQPVRATPFPKRSPYGPDDIRELTEALQTQDLHYTSGGKVTEFEKAFAALYGYKYAVLSTSGTSAVHIAVAALNLEAGDEIITAPVTDFGTVAGIIFQGLIPIFADWKPGQFNLDPEDIERKITPRTRAIVPVHFFGNPCAMDAIVRIAARHKLVLIEDCAEAFCTPYRGKWVGMFGDMSCFSFQQSKHLATGEGGVTITNDEHLHAQLRLLRDKGWQNRSHFGSRMYTQLGLNYRPNQLTAAVALAQLRKVEGVVKAMNRLGTLLTSLLSDIDGVEPCPVTEGGRHSYWYYAYRVTGFDPQAFVAAVAAEGIPTRWSYCVVPIYLCTEALTAKRTFGTSSFPFTAPYTQRNVEYKAGLCPVAEREQLEFGIVRFYENWTDDDIRDVANAIRKVAAGMKRRR